MKFKQPMVVPPRVGSFQTVQAKVKVKMAVTGYECVGDGLTRKHRLLLLKAMDPQLLIHLFVIKN